MGLKVFCFCESPRSTQRQQRYRSLKSEGLMQLAIKTVKAACPEMLVMTDVALDPYSSYGHDGIVEKGEIVNDATKPFSANGIITRSSRGRFCCP